MKTLTHLLLIITVLFTACTPKQERAIITGKITGEAYTHRLVLNKMEHGEMIPVASAIPGENKEFAFMYKVEKPGVFVISLELEDGKNLTWDHRLNRFYLNNNENIDIELTDKNYKLVSAQLKENEILSDWNNKVDSLFSYAMPFEMHSTYKDFFPLVPGYEKMTEDFRASINSGNKDFDRVMDLIAETDMAYGAMMFIMTPRTIHPKKEDYPEYYERMVKTDFFKHANLLDIPFCKRLLGIAPGFKYRHLDGMPSRDTMNEYYDGCRNYITNDTLKGYAALDDLRRYRTYDDSYLTFKEKISPYLVNDYLKDKVKEHEIKIRTYEKGAKAFDFSGTDVNGKRYKLSDFKGKLVYVDVWATWCGPCKAEIPHLKKLEKQYHGKPIEFLSISVDKQSDKQKWIDFVKENNLKGIQLIGDNAFQSDVATAYGIKAIPRFMLFDKEGKVVTIDAPRPSKAETKKLLDKYL